MAEQSAQNVVNQAQSVDDSSSIDVSGTSHTTSSAFGASGVEDEAATSTKSSSILPTEFLHSPSSANDPPTETPAIESLGPSSTNAINNAGLLPDEKLEEPTVNGDSGSYDSSEDAGYQHSASGDTVHSDPDQIKVAGLEHTLGDARIDRSSALKRPMAFKAVSVTKNFLAKSAIGSVASAKPANEKSSIVSTASPSPVPVAKPRLVAKSGKDARLVGLLTGSGANGPDASKVWNRNRPAAPPVPKQFTDEELKQQYGIHLATRLQSDEAGKDSKWADIDDDEDDWAPEATVEWMDGTKSTATPTDGKPALLGLSRPHVIQQLDSQNAASGAMVGGQKISTISSLGKTILRPGARIVSQTKPGVVLKSLPEGATTLEKSATSGTAKSPWATLPPVDKASPITFEPPAPTKQVVTASKDYPGSGPALTVAPIAREIAADDFSRGARDGEASSRELFNSQSGRYEPVKGGRRLSRHEAGFRPPAVLQRPSQSGYVQENHGGDAESKIWTRPHDSFAASGRNASGRLSEQSSEAPPEGLASPTYSQHLPEQSPSASTVRPPNWSNASHEATEAPQRYSSRGGSESSPTHETGVATEDNYGLQQRLMREKIELNRKRKQEEEAREEAARKERIRLKLEALAKQAEKDAVPQLSEDVPKPHGERSEASPKKPEDMIVEAERLPSQVAAIQEPRQRAPVVDEPQAKRMKISESAKTALASELSHIPKVAPKHTERKDLSEPKGEMTMNVQAPRSPPISDHESASKAIASIVDVPASFEPLSSPRPLAGSGKSPIASGQRLMQSLSDNDVQGISHEVQQLPGLGIVSPDDRPTQPWNGLPQKGDPTMGWPSTASLNISNVWGPPSKDRRLGNGAFNAEVQRPQSLQRPTPGQGQTGQMSNRLVQAPPEPNFEPAQLSQLHQQLGRTEDKLQGQQWSHSHAGPQPPQYSSRQYGYPLPDQAPQHYISDQQQAAKRAWKDFSGVINRSDQQPLGASTPPSEIQPTFKETYRQTTAGDILGQRQVVSVSKTIHEGQHAGSDGDAAVLPQPSAYLQSSPIPTSTASFGTGNNRPSRFFGPIAEKLGTNLSTLGTILDVPLSRPASPPPPDSFEHPAFGKTSPHPLVHLPTPAPKVRLPPLPVHRDTPAPPVNMSESVSNQPRFRLGPQPIVNQAAWQDRFNGLFNRASRPATNIAMSTTAMPVDQPMVVTALAVETSSKVAFDVAMEATTVSLPSATVSKATSELAALHNASPESKASVEELMDDREFGDKPTVHIPKPEYSENLAVAHAMPLQNSKATQLEKSGAFGTTVNPLSFEELDADQKVENGLRVFIRMLGQEIKSKILLRRFTGRPKPLRNKKRNSSMKADGTNGQPTLKTASQLVPNHSRSAHQVSHANNYNSNGEQKPRMFGTSDARLQQNGPVMVGDDAKNHVRKDRGWSKPPRGLDRQGYKDNRV